MSDKEIIQAFKSISEALKNIGWDAVCANGHPSENYEKAMKEIAMLDSILKSKE